MRSKRSVLFVRPDYHCSFFYRDELRKNGWKADIYVPNIYPEYLLYSSSDILRSPKIKNSKNSILRLIDIIMNFFWWHTIFWRYSTHIYYGRPPVLQGIDKFLSLLKIFRKDFVWELSISKLFNINLIYIPSGCRDNDLKKTWSTFDSGNVCNNCGYYNQCDDLINEISFKIIRKYFSFSMGGDSEAKSSSQIECKINKYKSIDLDLWSPNLEIPEEYLLPKTKNLRILHSAFLDKSGRSWKGRNIKGSPYIIEAIKRLKEEGHSVEYFFINNKKSNEMRFYQAQADIVVEQLIYGWWGSTFVEASALGKPVVCYLRPSFKNFFLNNFSEYRNLPILEADTKSIYDVLKRLVVDSDLRTKSGIESRVFAEQHFDSEKNAQSLIKLIS